jgi:hypothetical protein
VLTPFSVLVVFTQLWTVRYLHSSVGRSPPPFWGWTWANSTLCTGCFLTFAYCSSLTDSTSSQGNTKDFLNMLFFFFF